MLAVSGGDDYPYAVPVSYAFDESILYFHGAKSGHRLDAIRRNPRAFFCVINQDRILPETDTICFRSVIAFGKWRILEDGQEKR